MKQLASRDAGPRRPYGRDVSTPDRGPRSPETSGPGLRSRRRLYLAGVLSLVLAVLAVTQWVLADDSRSRWLGGVQGFFAIGLAIGYLVQARGKDGRRPR